MTVRFDYDRVRRLGMPEAVLAEGKTDAQLEFIVRELLGHPDRPVLFTRLDEHRGDLIARLAGDAVVVDRQSGTAALHGQMSAERGSVVLVTAGTSDLGVAGEAQKTLAFLGYAPTCIADVGVAGLWRLLERLDEIDAADVVIVVAGMDGALASVMGGLTGKPLVAVPTSTGYGASAKGETALRSMLASCAQGVLVTNIDNGFGAACAAHRMLRMAGERDRLA